MSSKSSGSPSPRAFLSYAHEDRELAERLQRRLQSFAKPWYRLKRLDVFRDSSHLTGTSLEESLRAALDGAEHLILLASPAAAASDWVDRELVHWLGKHAVGSIHLVLADGELCWDDARGGFDTSQSTALPPALAQFFAQEPLWCDLRGWVLDGPRRQARLENAVADLACAILGLPKDQLIGEDVEQHRRLLRLRNAASAGLALLTAAASVAALVAYRKSVESERRLQAGFELAVESLQAIEDLRDLPGAAPVRKKLIENNTALLNTLAPDLSGQDRRLRSHQARASVFDAKEAMDHADWTAARALLDRAEGIYRDYPGDFWAVYGLSDVFDRRAQLAAHTGDVEQRRLALEAAVKFARQAHAQRPADVASGLEVSLDNLGSYYAETGQLALAKQYHEEAAGIAERLYRAAPSNLDLAQDLVGSYLMLYELSQKSGRPEPTRLKEAWAILPPSSHAEAAHVAATAIELAIASAACAVLPTAEREGACATGFAFAKTLGDGSEDVQVSLAVARLHLTCADPSVTANAQAASEHGRAGLASLRELAAKHPDFVEATDLLTRLTSAAREP